MEIFGFIGFIFGSISFTFGLVAFTVAFTNSNKVKALEERINELESKNDDQV